MSSRNHWKYTFSHVSLSAAYRLPVSVRDSPQGPLNGTAVCVSFHVLSWLLIPRMPSCLSLSLVRTVSFCLTASLISFTLFYQCPSEGIAGWFLIYTPASIELQWKFSYISPAQCTQCTHRINLRSEIYVVNFHRLCHIAFPPVVSACLILHSLTDLATTEF